MAKMKKQDILLESGTGELEILKFIVDDSSYAINVLKVREILRIKKEDIKKLPDKSDVILGMTNIRGDVIMIVNLSSYLNSELIENDGVIMAILAEFNATKILFAVDNVVGIDRIGWDDIQPPDRMMGELVNGVIKSDENKEVDWKEQQQTQKLRQRDNEVRQHEAAHKTTGGKYAGNISYTYQQGPDGNRYAVGGEVGMDISPEAGDPEKTIEKAETVRKAALAPAQPSGQDLKIAAKAAKMKMQASAELKQEDSKLNKSNKLNSLDNLYKNSEQPNQSSAQISLVA
jgi:chemotaxis signal transduction protein